MTKKGHESIRDGGCPYADWWAWDGSYDVSRDGEPDKFWLSVGIATFYGPVFIGVLVWNIRQFGQWDYRNSD
jgi:hypothetical protein